VQPRSRGGRQQQHHHSDQTTTTDQFDGTAQNQSAQVRQKLSGVQYPTVIHIMCADSAMVCAACAAVLTVAVAAGRHIVWWQMSSSSSTVHGSPDSKQRHESKAPVCVHSSEVHYILPASLCYCCLRRCRRACRARTCMQWPPSPPRPCHGC
jgi:hypothetical protein